MKTLRITLKDGVFFKTNKVGLEFFSPKHIIANGWICKVRDHLGIECIADCGIAIMKYTIDPKGFAQLTLKLAGTEKAEVLRKGFVVESGKVLRDGIIFLTDGEVGERTAYFRNIEFQKFIEKRKIDAIKHENPNKVYTIKNKKVSGKSKAEYILTDGSFEMTPNSVQTHQWLENGFSNWEHSETVRILNAKWVLVVKEKFDGKEEKLSAVLYTLERFPAKTCTNIPEMEKILTELEHHRVMSVL